ncbi:hypothetical protein [Paenibacillus sp. 7541]|uniref:hypothetical protein n=1 Tax=Paenibacillus sp. 7541 TaxID=2026236 RepID=UPI000BA78F17|nr:hypothetical protein [Paenibacillus sp. 7541]PAK51091.1 hypothetical protein CHH75_15275 [Paenibacillus sp. 7541]
MKLFLFISQSIYALMLVPWLIVWGVSFMVFDSGLSLWGVGIMIMVTLYPIAVAVCSLLSWIYVKKMRPLSIVAINLVPSIWIMAFVLIIFVF